MLLICASGLQAPVLMVLAFGLYCLASLIHGVLTFRTVPAEAELLQKVEMLCCSIACVPSRCLTQWPRAVQDIMEARADLKAKGLIAV